MWKRIRYYVYAAIIVILCGIYIFSLPLIANSGNIIHDTISKYFSCFLLFLLCLLNIVRTAKTTGNYLMKYGKLADEEKELYDISKVKMAQILYILSWTILLVFDSVFSSIYPNVIPNTVFIVCCLVGLVFLFIFAATKWILNLFCRKK